MKKTLLIAGATLVACSVVGFASCKKKPDNKAKEEYTITFLVGGGEDNIVYTLKAGDGIITPSDPERDYYTFDGWYSDEALTIPYTATTMPEGNVTVYSKWTAQKRVRLYFLANGGSFGTGEDGTKVVSATSVFDVGEETEAYGVEPTREGYRFDGWCLDAAGSQSYAFGEAPEEDVVLYAKWRKNTSEYYYISYIVNGEKLAENPVKKGETTTAYAFDETSGLCVDEWYEGDSSSATTYDFTTAPTSSLQLFGYPYTKGLTFSGSSVTGYTGSAAEVVIPAKYNNYTIMSVAANAVKSNTTITSVEVPDTVTTLGEYAFAECTYLRTISLPANISEVGAYAFYRCERLESAITLKHVRQIKESVFNSCERLTSVTFGEQLDSVGAYAFAGCIAMKSLSLPSTVKQIGAYAFADDTALTSFALPGSLTSLGAGALSGCLALSSVTIDASNTAYTVKDGDLYTKDGKTLILYVKGDETSYTIASAVETIQTDAFSCATNLTSLVIGENVQTIESGALKGAKNLVSLTIPFLGGSADDSSAYFSYIFGAESGFLNGESGKFTPASLTTLKILKQVTEVPNYAFYGCTGLKEIEGLENATSYGNQAFAYTGFETFTIPSSVAQIAILTTSSSGDYYPFGQNVFGGCKSLTAIFVDSANAEYTSINGCLYTKDGKTLLAVPGGLKEITFAQTAETISTCAFFDTMTASVTIPDTIKTINLAAFYRCTRLEEMTVPFIGESETENTQMLYIFGSAENVPALLRKVTYTGSATALPDRAFYNLKGVTEINYPDTVTTIGDYAFYGTAITSLNLGSGVTTIGEYAFASTSLTGEIVVPAKITSLGSYAFAFNQSITKATIAEGIKEIPEGLFFAYQTGSSSSGYYYYSSLEEIVIPASVETIGAGAFYYAGSNYYYNYAAGQQTDEVLLTIANGSKLKTIGDSAFAYSGVTKLSLPATVTSIGSLAFFGCDQLSEVTIGTAAEGSAIASFSVASFGYCNALRTFTIYKDVKSAEDVPQILSTSSYSATTYNLFYQTSEIPSIYVNGVQYYKAADHWSVYADNISEMPESKQ